MSVILFRSTDDIYKNMAQSYEGLKTFATNFDYRVFTADDDYHFYKSLRRLYFANVACFLCQYHDHTPLSPDELQGIETFTAMSDIKRIAGQMHQKLVQQFLDAWNGLKYNLCTNDGELYKAIDSFEFMEELARVYTRSLVRSLARQECELLGLDK